jgi:hypothetical protein
MKLANRSRAAGIREPGSLQKTPLRSINAEWFRQGQRVRSDMPGRGRLRHHNVAELQYVTTAYCHAIADSLQMDHTSE